MMRVEAPTVLGAALFCGGVVGACSHEWDLYDPRLEPDGAGGATAVTSSSSSGATGGAPASSASSGTRGTGGAPARCGNGVIDPAEECDDANSDPADGCDGCQVQCGATNEFEDPTTHACYALLPPSTWADSVAACKAWGGHLATVTSQPELDFVRTFVTGDVWLGGDDIATEGTWVWDDGEPWSFAPWNVGEPDDAMNLDAGIDGEDCLELFDDVSDADPFGFSDDSCTHVQSPICERDAAGMPPP